MAERVPAVLDPQRIKDELNRICGPPDPHGLSWSAAKVTVSHDQITVTTSPQERHFIFVTPRPGTSTQGSRPG